MISYGYYLINGSGQNVYYYSIQYNSYQYGNQVLAYTVPTSLPSGYSAPSHWAGYPSVSRIPLSQYLEILLELSLVLLLVIIHLLVIHNLIQKIHL